MLCMLARITFLILIISKKSYFEAIHRYIILSINRVKKRENSTKFLIHRLIILTLLKNERISN